MHRDNPIKGVEANESAKQRDLTDKTDTDIQEIKEGMAEARTMVTLEGYHARRPKRESGGEYMKLAKKPRFLDMDAERTAEDDHTDMTRRFVDEAKTRELNPRCMDTMIQEGSNIANLTKDKCLARHITEAADYKEGEVVKLGETKDTTPGCKLTPRTEKEMDERRKERQKDLEDRQKRMEEKGSSRRDASRDEPKKTMWSDLKRMDVDERGKKTEFVDNRVETPGSSSKDRDKRTVLTPRAGQPTAMNRADSARDNRARTGSARGYGSKRSKSVGHMNHSHRLLTDENRDKLEPGDHVREITDANGFVYFNTRSPSGSTWLCAKSKSRDRSCQNPDSMMAWNFIRCPTIAPNTWGFFEARMDQT